MEVFELVLSFIIGAACVTLFATLFSVKTKGVFRLLLNSVAGAVLLLALSLFKVIVLPVNPLTACVVGLLGVPGLVAVILIVVF